MAPAAARLARALAAAAALPALAAAAAAAAGPGELPADRLAQLLRDDGAVLTALPPAGELQGWLVRRAAGGLFTLYVAPSGHGVMGIAYGPDGRRVPASPPAPAATPAPGALQASPAPAAAAAWEGAGAAWSFGAGAAGPEVRIFADPGCPWSRLAVARLARRALAGRLRLRIVPVGLLGAASARSAMAVAASPAPLEAWLAGDAAPATAAAARRIAGNNAAFAAAGAAVVPAIYVAGGDGTPRRLADGTGALDAWLAEAAP